MLLGQVIGNVVATVKEGCYVGLKTLWVQPIDLDGKPKGDAFVTFDVVDAGGAILVRVNRHSLPMYGALKRRIDVPALLAATRRRGHAQEQTVTVKTQGGRETAARLCWVWLPKPEAEKARARVAREGGKTDDELDAAEYMVLLTTAPRTRLSVDQVLDLYRARWQIELNFKRDKTIGQLDRLPSLTPATIQAWICANVLLGLIARRLSAQSVDIPPCGIARLIIPCTEAAGSASTSHRRRALVRDAAGLEPNSRRTAALHAA